MKRINTVRFGVLALTLTTICAPQRAEAQEKPTLKFGLVAFMTGPLAGAIGSSLRNGVELLTEAVRTGAVPTPYATKGFGGLDAEIILVDESGGSTKQATEFRALVQQRGADAVLGYNSAGTCLAVAPLAEELKTLTLLASCGANVVEEGKSKYVFHTTMNLHADGVAAARYLVKANKEVKSFAGINQNFAYGQDSWRDFSLSMMALAPNVQAVASQFPNTGSNQYGADISKLLSLAPDATHSSLNGTDLESFLAQATPRDLQSKTRLVLAAGEGIIYRNGDKVPDGTMVGARGTYGIFAHDTELNRWFQKTYFERFNIAPNYLAYQGAQAVIALKIAFDNASAKNGGKKPTQDELVAALQGIEFEAFGTKVQLIRGNGHQAILEHAMGTYKFDPKTNKPTMTNVVYFPAECVNPPEAVNSTEWIKSGFKGSKC